MQLSDDQARDCMRLAERVARSECRRYRCPQWQDDAAGEAIKAAVSEAGRFDPSKFSNFAVFIRMRMHFRVRDWMRQMGLTVRSQGDALRISVDSIEITDWDSPTDAPQLRDSIVLSILRCLNERERYVIEQLILCDRTQEDLAHDMGIGPSRVSQIRSTAIEKLRKRLVN